MEGAFINALEALEICQLSKYRIRTILNEVEITLEYCQGFYKSFLFHNNVDLAAGWLEYETEQERREGKIEIIASSTCKAAVVNLIHVYAYHIQRDTVLQPQRNRRLFERDLIRIIERLKNFLRN